MKSKIDKIKTLDCLNTQYQDDSEKLEILKDAIEREQFFIDKDGSTNYSSEFIRTIGEIDRKRMSPEEMSISILISYVNYINHRLEANYSIEDKLIKGLAITAIDFVKRAIFNKNNIEYWQKIEENLKK